MANETTTKQVQLALEQGELEPLFEGGLAAIDLLFEIAISTDKRANKANLLLRQLALLATLDTTEIANLIKDMDVQPIAEYARILLALDQGSDLANVDATSVELLLRASNLPSLAKPAQNVLGKLTNIEAQEKLCRIVIEDDQPAIKAIVLASGYLPREAYERALFLFLSDQWEAYRVLDFDYSLLRAAYSQENEKIQSRIVAKIRELGHIELLEVFKSKTNSNDWQLTFDVIVKNKNWSKLWNFVEIAPPIWSVKALNLLADQPKQIETEGFSRLIKFVVKCNEVGLSLGNLVRNKLNLKEHTSNIIQVRLSADGRLLASLDQLHTLCVWQIPNGKLLYKIDDECRADAFVFSPDSRMLAVEGSNNAQAQLWLFEAVTGKIISCQAGQNYLPHSGLDFVAGGSLLVSITPRKVRLYAMPQGELVRVVPISKSLYSVLPIVNPQGDLLVYLTDEHQLHFSRLPSGDVIKKLPNVGSAYHLEFSPDGKRVLVSGYDDFFIYDNTGQFLFKIAHSGRTETLVFNQDSTLLASASQQHGDYSTVLKIRNASNGNVLRTIKTEPIVQDCLAFSPDGVNLIEYDLASLKMWRVANGEKIAGVPHSGVYPPQRLVISSNGDFIVITSDNFIQVWTSHLVELAKLPFDQISVVDFEWLKETLKSDLPNQNERIWLEFIEALLNYKWRHEIELGENVALAVREFDIEID